MRTNTFIDDWIEEAEEKGYVKGHQEGHQTGRREGRQEGEWLAHHQSLLLPLGSRFEPVPMRLIARLDKLSVSHLGELFELTLQADSLASIEDTIDKMIS